MDKKNDKEFVDKYLDLLNDSIFSICPRGTGVGSIRLWESMSMGCIPIILSDDYKEPKIIKFYDDGLINDLSWNDFSYHIKEKDVHLIKDLVKYHMEKNKFSFSPKSFYNDYFSNDKLYLSVVYELKRRGIKVCI